MKVEASPPKNRSRNKWVRVTASGVALLLGWLVILGIQIVHFGSKDRAARSDVVIVLGAAVVGDELSPVFKERVRHAIALYREAQASKIIFTGGVGGLASVSESETARRWAMGQGVPPSDILTENTSRTTFGNLQEAQRVMKEHHLNSAIIVSDPYHMKRALLMCDALGIESVSSPTPSTRYISLRTKAGFLL
jgi:uncharacterized SAM-binding protein YcdF (DUF218 family)